MKLECFPVNGFEMCPWNLRNTTLQIQQLLSLVKISQALRGAYMFYSHRIFAMRRDVTTAKVVKSQ